MSQTGRAAAQFSWCPPPLTNLGGPGVPGCTNINQGGFPAIIKYNGTANSFGGTMALVTKAKAGTGNLAIGVGAGAVAFNLLPKGISLATGRGLAQYNTGVIPSGQIWGNHMVAKKYVGPRLGSQNIITMVTALQPTMWPAGVAHTWGFPWTTRTVVVRTTGVMTATVTGKGWDCPGGMQGPGCGVATGMGTMTLGMVPGAVARNISLVAGGVGFAALPPPFGNVPTQQFGSMQILLPEPGPTSQLLAGVIAVLGIAAWRWRRTR
jgi:hypothetical protein